MGFCLRSEPSGLRTVACAIFVLLTCFSGFAHGAQEAPPDQTVEDESPEVDDRLVVVTTPFDVESVPDELREFFGDALMTELESRFDRERFRVVSRSMMQVIDEERLLEESELVGGRGRASDLDTSLQAPGDFILTGRAFRYGSKYVFYARLVDRHSGDNNRGATVEMPDRDFEHSDDAIHRIAQALANRLSVGTEGGNQAMAHQGAAPGWGDSVRERPSSVLSSAAYVRSFFATLQVGDFGHFREDELERSGNTFYEGDLLSVVARCSDAAFVAVFATNESGSENLIYPAFRDDGTADSVPIDAHRPLRLPRNEEGKFVGFPVQAPFGQTRLTLVATKEPMRFVRLIEDGLGVFRVDSAGTRALRGELPVDGDADNKAGVNALRTFNEPTEFALAHLTIQTKPRPESDAE